MSISVRNEEDSLQRIRKLTEVSRAITYAASLDEVFQLTVERAADLLAAEGSLLVVRNDDGLMALRSSHGVDASRARHVREPLSEALIPRLARCFDAQPQSVLGVPLVVAGGIQGLLVVIRPAAPGDADQHEWLLSALADQAAVALERKRLSGVGELREQLMGIVGHDLRSPLNTIVMGARLLTLGEGLGEKEAELVRRITNSALLAARLIDQLLDMTRGRLGGGIPIEPTRFNLSDVLRQVTGEAELTHPDRPLHVETLGDLTGVWDRDRMYQLLGNLVDNAIRHGEPRTLIALRIHGGETDVIIEITNRGEPIPPETLPFIFDAFRQGRTAHPSRAHGLGLGLGLFIAQQIAHSHGGSINATSSASAGTTFRVRLPRDATPAGAAEKTRGAADPTR
jgi:signal transduction histidine kinase